MVPAAGLRIDDLILVAPLGRGAQASVWRARREHPRDGASDVVAVKLAQLRGSKDGLRAKRESVALSHLRHPSLPRCARILDGLGDGWLALELELVDGTDLGEACARLDLPARRLALLHVARALAHLHRAGLVHRDVKPANIMVAHDFASAPDDPARCKLVDLGIAVRTGNPAPLTVLGHPGTLPFMAPEALLPSLFPYPAGKPTLDVFAFGVTGWRVLRDRHPTGLAPDPMTEDLVAAYADHAGAEHLFLPPEDLADPWERVLAACLRLRADQRPQDAAAIVAMLEDATRNPRTARPADTLPRTAPRLDAAAERTEPAPHPPVRPPPVAVTLRDVPPTVIIAPPPPALASPIARPSPLARPAQVPRRPTSSPEGTTSTRARPLWMFLGVTSVVATLAAIATVMLAGRSPTSDDPPFVVERAVIVPVEPEVPSTRLTADPAPSAAPVDRHAPRTAPPTEWDTVGQSNVRHSDVLGCETKVLGGWFHARCIRRPGEDLWISGDDARNARVATDATSTTVLIPLDGRDITLIFDWRGGRGMRTLHLVGHEVARRIESQGEFSAP